MFLRLLWESFARQRRRKALAAIAILLGTTAVTAMLALATTIGDRIHRELAVYGANLVVYPKADLLEVKVGGVDIKPSNGGAYLKEGDLEKLKGIFWANNITGISPELSLHEYVVAHPGATGFADKPLAASFTGLWFAHSFGSLRTGAPQLHPWWRLQGRWPEQMDPNAANVTTEVVVGAKIAARLHLNIGDQIFYYSTREQNSDGLPGPQSLAAPLVITGIVATGDATEDQVLLSLADAQVILGLANFGLWQTSPIRTMRLRPLAVDSLSRIEISARTRPEDAFARLDPDKLSPRQHDIWYCRPYANSIAYQIMEAIPGSHAEQVRRVEQTEGTVLSRISGLMWLVSAAALLAAGFAVSAAMATAVLERRGEIGLMRSLGASKGAIALLFYSESALLAVGAGTLGYLAGSLLAFWLGGRIFSGDGAAPMLNVVLLPVVVAMALLVAVAGSTPSIRSALNHDPWDTLRGDR